MMDLRGWGHHYQRATMPIYYGWWRYIWCIFMLEEMSYTYSNPHSCSFHVWRVSYGCIYVRWVGVLLMGSVIGTNNIDIRSFLPSVWWILNQIMQKVVLDVQRNCGLWQLWQCLGHSNWFRNRWMCSTSELAKVFYIKHRCYRKEVQLLFPILLLWEGLCHKNW